MTDHHYYTHSPREILAAILSTPEYDEVASWAECDDEFDPYDRAYGLVIQFCHDRGIDLDPVGVMEVRLELAVVLTDIRQAFLDLTAHMFGVMSRMDGMARARYQTRPAPEVDWQKYGF